MSDDLIRRSDAIKAVNKAKAEGMTECPTYYLGIVPTIEPKRGEWIDRSDGIEGAWNYCSVCGEQAIDLYDFCPNCGARMKGE